MLGGGGVRAVLLISLEPRKPLFHWFAGRISYFCSDRDCMEGEASLYGRRWRSNSTAQARRYESTGDVLSLEDISGDVTDSDGKSRP